MNRADDSFVRLKQFSIKKDFTPAYCRDLDKETLAAALKEADESKRAQYLEMADETIRPFYSISA